jgi:hypothetical protein
VRLPVQTVVLEWWIDKQEVGLGNRIADSLNDVVHQIREHNFP